MTKFFFNYFQVTLKFYVTQYTRNRSQVIICLILLVAGRKITEMPLTFYDEQNGECERKLKETFLSVLLPENDPYFIDDKGYVCGKWGVSMTL